MDKIASSQNKLTKDGLVREGMYVENHILNLASIGERIGISPLWTIEKSSARCSPPLICPRAKTGRAFFLVPPRCISINEGPECFYFAGNATRRHSMPRL